jgi:AAA15 family ATPase/GTPase
MKITGIDIGEYRQFKNINFDFTYPEDYHVVEKRGQPLEKVCFIGQSGTGKTTLLNVIWDFSQVMSQTAAGRGHKINVDILPAHDVLADFFYSTQFNFTLSGRLLTFDRTKIAKEIRDRDFLSDWYTNRLNKDEKLTLESTNKVCIYLKDSIAREADAFLADQRKQPESFSDFFKTTTQIEEDQAVFKVRIDTAGSNKTVSLGDMRSLSTWQYLLEDTINYDRGTPKFVFELGQKRASPEEISTEFHNWLGTNPRIELGEKCINPILANLYLELGLIGEDGAILSLRTKSDSKIPNNTLSTGTRQLLATAIPIYKFDTKSTVILFDEPERSLFPDIQRELVKYYTGLAPEAQFFFATHSPIIAAAFEPEERFILYFDENGEVKFRKGKAPIGDDPNDILHDDFGLSEVMLDEGLKAYKRYLNLFAEIKNEKDPVRKKALMVEQTKLGDQYKF